MESDPACVKILTELDDATAVLTSPGEDLDRALRACVSSDVLAVDLEGVSMSRVGAVTLLQVAVRDSVFLFDAQALGTAELFERAVSVDETDENDGPKARTAKKTLRGVLEDGQITKLMFDCRVDSDALFHQHGVALRGVFDVQLADVASRAEALLEKVESRCSLPAQLQAVQPALVFQAFPLPEGCLQISTHF